MPDQILVLRETARSGPGPGNGGRPELPAGTKLFVYGDSLSNRTSWQPTVANYFGIPWDNFAVGSTTAVDRGGSSGSNPNNLTNFINRIGSQTDLAGTGAITTTWFGYNDWAAASPQVDIGTDADIVRPQTDPDKRQTYKGALSYIVERLCRERPQGLHILVTIPGHQWDYDDRSRGFVQAAVDVANHHGIPYINMFTGAGINRWNFASFYTDHVHVGTDLTNDRNVRGALRWANVFINKIASYYAVTQVTIPAIAELTAEVGDLDPPPAWAREREQRGV